MLAAMIALVVAWGCTACGVSSPPHATRSSSETTSTPRSSSVNGRGQRPGWLGLNYNSSARSGRVDDFARRGVVWDRLGSLELGAGQTPSNDGSLARGLARSLHAGMVPDVVINTVTGPTGCATNPNTSNLCQPISAHDALTYVRGFVATVRSIRRRYPHDRIVFEPTDEPWSWAAPPGTLSGRLAAGEFAALLARLLPAVRAAGIPLSVIYVPATGTLDDGTQWIMDLYAARPCLAPGRQSCGPIEGWNLHPYGPPEDATAGIRSVPRLRSSMRSGEGNLVISEIGFCASNVQSGAQCDENRTDIVGTSTETTRWLTETLDLARPMHDAGWLKALILWDRSGGGWSMQIPGGQLTAQGVTLSRFAIGRP